MNILLGESDGFLYENGKAKNIIVTVNGRVKFPFSAEKPISDLYEAAKKIPDNGIRLPDYPEEARLGNEVAQTIEYTDGQVMPPPQDRSTEISREDIVKCVKVRQGLTGAGGETLQQPELILGRLYRVLKVKAVNMMIPGSDKMTRMVDSYDVLDDKADVPRRIMAYPEELELVSKGRRPEKKKSVFEMTYSCEECSEPNVLVLDEVKNKYIGVCAKCKRQIEQDRPVQHEQPNNG